MWETPNTCVCCGRVARSVQDGNVIFDAKGGNDGSRVYDNIMGTQPTYVRAVICDKCFVEKLQGGVLQAFVHQQVRRPDPKAVFWDPAKGPFQLDPADDPEHEGDA